MIMPSEDWGKITFVTRFLPSENKVYTYIHTDAEECAAVIEDILPLCNGVARIFVWGGHFSMISAGRPDSVGGGSTRNFPGSPLAGQTQWGG